MTGETVALTYAELAERLGIEVASAKMRARRGRWRREPGNDGRTRVQVPVDVLEEAPPPPPGAPAPPLAAVPPDAAEAVVALREAHAAEIARMEAAHRAAMDALREAHLAEVARIEAVQQRDREAHTAEMERIRVDHGAEIARLVEAHRQVIEAQRFGTKHIRAGLANARQWLAGITSRR